MGKDNQTPYEIAATMDGLVESFRKIGEKEIADKIEEWGVKFGNVESSFRKNIADLSAEDAAGKQAMRKFDTIRKSEMKKLSSSDLQEIVSLIGVKNDKRGEELEYYLKEEFVATKRLDQLNDNLVVMNTGITSISDVIDSVSAIVSAGPGR